MCTPHPCEPAGASQIESSAIERIFGALIEQCFCHIERPLGSDEISFLASRFAQVTPGSRFEIARSGRAVAETLDAFGQCDGELGEGNPFLGSATSLGEQRFDGRGVCEARIFVTTTNSIERRKCQELGDAAGSLFPLRFKARPQSSRFGERRLERPNIGSERRREPPTGTLIFRISPEAADFVSALFATREEMANYTTPRLGGKTAVQKRRQFAALGMFHCDPRIAFQFAHRHQFPHLKHLGNGTPCDATERSVAETRRLKRRKSIVFGTYNGVVILVVNNSKCTNLSLSSNKLRTKATANQVVSY